jgi:hypothetical protein
VIFTIKKLSVPVLKKIDARIVVSTKINRRGNAKTMFLVGDLKKKLKLPHLALVGFRA